MAIESVPARVAESASATRPWNAANRERLAGYLFIAPDVIGLTLFVAVPMLLALGLGFFDVDGFGGYRFIGLQNYGKMLHDPLFWKSLRATLIYVGLLVPALYVSGLGLALLVRRTTTYNGVLRAMLFLPQMVSLVVVALVWQMLMVDKIGLFNRLLGALGLSALSFLGDPTLALYSVVLISGWFLMGFYMLIFLGGLHDIPPEYYDAARVDGAGASASFWHITLPLLRPTSLFVLLTSLVTAVAGGAAFDLVYVMTKGGPANSTSLLIYYIYEQAFKYNSFGYAGAMASILVLLLSLVTLVLFRVTRGGRFGYE
jgi:multiple sugar transport system permease protein